MKNSIIGVFLLFSISICAQPLRDINYFYLYNPNGAFTFKLNSVRSEGSVTIFYALYPIDTTGMITNYTIQWEGRELLSDQEGKNLPIQNNNTTQIQGGLEGRATISSQDAPKFIVARVINKAANRAWLFYTGVEQNLSVNNYLTRKGVWIPEPFIYTGEKVRLAVDSGKWIVSYYNDNFPPAAPAFSEAQARVARAMVSDSTFQVQGGKEITFQKKGLYLVQKDTLSSEGLSFRVEEDYPQYSNVINLAGPLIYICTKQEYDRLELAKGNKRAFDRVILTMASDTERARKLMRNYFRRVELANQYFTSYKEGWKTDRGMIYIIFGAPDEVYKFNDREVWNYKNGQFIKRFTYSRSSSLYDPDNYVLIREDKFKDAWYEVIDLWRNARF